QVNQAIQMGIPAHEIDDDMRSSRSLKTSAIRTLSRLFHTCNITNRSNPASVSLPLLLLHLSATPRCKRHRHRDTSSVKSTPHLNSLTFPVQKHFLAEIALLVARGHLDIQSGLELSSLVKTWIDSRHGRFGR